MTGFPDGAVRYSKRLSFPIGTIFKECCRLEFGLHGVRTGDLSTITDRRRNYFPVFLPGDLDLVLPGAAAVVVDLDDGGVIVPAVWLLNYRYTTASVFFCYLDVDVAVWKI